MISDFLKPRTEDETVIQILTGPKWNGDLRRWEWAFFAYFWNLAPAYCGRCGRCTNPNNVEPCGHDEAKKHVRGQVFITSLEEFEQRVLKHDRIIRYIRDGKVVGETEAKQHG